MVLTNLILINLTLQMGQRFQQPSASRSRIGDFFVFFAGMDDGAMFRFPQEGVCIWLICKF